MARTMISVLTEDPWLSDRVKHIFKSVQFLVGYAGEDEQTLLKFIEANTLANHILFVKPTTRYLLAHNERYLQIKSKINILIIGPPLQEELKPIIHRTNISGYVTIDSITPLTAPKMVNQIAQKGYYSNDQIMESIWLKKPKGTQEYAMPTFTSREQQVLDLICHGFSSNDAAEILNCSVSNIHNHLIRIKQKSLVSSSLELVAISVANKWVQLSREKFKRHNPFVLNFTHPTN